MRLPHTDAQTPVRRERSDETTTRLNGRWLVLVKLIWVALVVFTLVFFFTSLVAYATYLREVCTNTDTSWITACRLGQVFTASARISGLAVESYSVFTVAPTLIWTLVWLFVAAVIFWRRSDDWMALLVAFLLVVEGTNASQIVIGLSQVSWAGQAFGPFFQFLDEMCFVLVVFLFPSGRFVPRWTRWLAAALIALFAFQAFFPDSPVNPNNWPPLLNALALPGLYGAMAFSQVYRYRRVSSVRQRQQTRWVVFAFSISLGGVAAELLGLELLPQYFPELRLPDMLYQVIDVLVWDFSPVLIPVFFGIAILRSRLWDIDVIINRTLVYGTLSATLALVYFGLVIALQSLVRGLTGQEAGYPLVVVCSTLVIAALFQPLRHRLQTIIDRRFYRRKYDAAKTLVAFSATLRNEVDLEQLREELVAVVTETMQPSHVSLWLRPAAPDRKHGTIGSSVPSTPERVEKS